MSVLSKFDYYISCMHFCVGNNYENYACLAGRRELDKKETSIIATDENN